jgi:hypothetical protein
MNTTFRKRGYTMSRIFGIASLLICVFSLVHCGESPRISSQIQSITPRGAKVGKWLITISIGREKDINYTLALRNELVPVFSKTRGGLYDQLIDMNDKTGSSIPPTKPNILSELKRAAETIKKFRAENPGAETMVVFGLTGHGGTIGNEYSFAVVDDLLTGGEIVNLIKSLHADETVLIVQSCQSGSLPNIHFKNEMSALAMEVGSLAAQENVVLSVAVPVDAKMESFSPTWEQEILRRTFLESKWDKNNDRILTYEEWKNAVMQISCTHEEFTVGLDPQFYDPRVPGGLPFILTDAGVEEYQNGSLAFPRYSSAPAVLWPETVKICEENRP